MGELRLAPALKARERDRVEMYLLSADGRPCPDWHAASAAARPQSGAGCASSRPNASSPCATPAAGTGTGRGAATGRAPGPVRTDCCPGSAPGRRRSWRKPWARRGWQEGNSIRELNALFHDEEEASARFEASVWPPARQCPRCGCSDTRKAAAADGLPLHRVPENVVGQGRDGPGTIPGVR